MTTELWPQVLPAPVYAAGTKPVGYPAVLFSPYRVPDFPYTSNPIDTVVTDVVVQSMSAVEQFNVPFTFGQPFKVGAVSPHNSLTGSRAGQPDVSLQMDVMATHPDGSVRHAVINGVLPYLAPGQKVTLALVRRAPKALDDTPRLDSAPAVAAYIIDNGVEYSAVVSGALSTEITSSKTWLSGDTTFERVTNLPLVDSAGTRHPHITAQFSIRVFNDTAKAKIDITLEHTKAYTAISDVPYDVRLLVDGQQRYVQTGLIHGPSRRWKKTFWHNESTPVHIRHNSRYLIDTLAVPNYDLTVIPDERTLAGWATEINGPTFVPMGRGPFTAAMGTTGGRPDIGLAPDSYAMTIISMDPRAKAMMLASADQGGGWAGHRRDDSNGPARGEPIDIIHFPYGSLIGTLGDTKNRATGQGEWLPKATSSSTLHADTSHQPAFAYLPYLLTGDYYYLEELIFWSNYNLYSLLPGYRGFEKGLFKGGQVRGQAWTLRTLAEAAYVTPDNHPSKAAFSFWMNANAESYSAFFLEGGTNHNLLGVNTSGYAIAYGTYATGMAPWQDDFFTSAVGHAVELGFGIFKPLLDWKAKFPIGRMTDPGFCWINASVYSLNIRDGWLVDGKVVHSPIFTTLAECYNKTFDAAYRESPCNSPERLAYIRKNIPDAGSQVLDQMTGYSDFTAGFPANMQPGLASAVDSGIEGAALAWTKFNGRAKKPNYGTSPQFAIIPRSFTPVVDVPEPVPTPVPTPTPTPDPIPVPAPPATTTTAVKLTGSITVKASALAKKTGLTVIVYDAATKAVVLTLLNRTASSTGTITTSSVKLLGGKKYAAYVRDADGTLLAGVIPA